MSSQFPELDGVRLTVPDEVRERHLTVITSALRGSRPRRPRRFRMLALAAALVLALPVIALAAEDSVPGDFLYPVKRVFEPVVALFDADVMADHRVSEAEALLERRADTQVIRDHVIRAREAVADDHPVQARRLDRIEHELEARIVDQQGPSDAQTSEPDRSDGAPGDRTDDRSSGPAVPGGDTTTTIPDGDLAGPTTTAPDDRTPTTAATRRDG